MKDLKSKLPDFKELTAIAGKFYNDLKSSVCEIINDYKKNHASEEEPTEHKTKDTKVEKKPETKDSKKTEK